MITTARTAEEAMVSLFGENTRETSRRSVSGGCISRASLLCTSGGEQIFLKENDNTLEGMFAAEARGLTALHEASSRVNGPRIPEPLAVGSDGRSQFILMTYIAPGRPGPGYEEAFGRAFAALHRDGFERRFGFFEDNFIGATPQPNAWSDDWTAFFGRYRLGFQCELAIHDRVAPGSLIRDVERLIQRLDEFLPDSPAPALLHGDLWSGNAMTDASGGPVLIDPAAYYGHNEADLAMTELFGGFPDRFYDAYNEVLPIPPEYRHTRRHIYGLYHILNHIHLFGASYVSRASSMLRAIL